MCYFNTEVRLTVIFQNTSLLAFDSQRSGTAHTLRTTITSPLFATITGSSAELRTTEQGEGTIITAFREGEMLKLVRQAHNETIFRSLRGTPPPSIACKTTTNLGRATSKVTVNSMQYLFWSYVFVRVRKNNTLHNQFYLWAAKKLCEVAHLIWKAKKNEHTPGKSNLKLTILYFSGLFVL